jgi:hypothetical protein
MYLNQEESADIRTILARRVASFSAIGTGIRIE